MSPWLFYLGHSLQLQGRRGQAKGDWVQFNDIPLNDKFIQIFCYPDVASENIIDVKSMHVVECLVSHNNLSLLLMFLGYYSKFGRRKRLSCAQ